MEMGPVAQRSRGRRSLNRHNRRREGCSLTIPSWCLALESEDREQGVPENSVRLVRPLVRFEAQRCRLQGVCSLLTRERGRSRCIAAQASHHAVLQSAPLLGALETSSQWCIAAIFPGVCLFESRAPPQTRPEAL